MLFDEGMRNWAHRRSDESAAIRQSGIGAWVGRRAEKRSGLLAAAIAGAASALALPPFFLIPLLAVSFPVFIWLIFGAATARRAGLIGVVFGLGHHVIGLYWISHSLLIDPWRHGWLIPFFVGGLALLLALFVGLAAAGALVLVGRRILPLLLALTAFWVLGEWLRSWVFTGFPWNLLGSVWLISERMIQVAAVTGTWGLSLLSLLVAGSFALLADGTSTRLARISAVAIAAFLLGSTYLYGMHRLSVASTETVEGVRLRLVQPNIAQTLKWAPGLAEAHLTKLMAMSMTDYKGQRITHVIWPETAVPFALERSPGLAEALARVVPPGGLLITGIQRVTSGPKGDEWHNSMVALDSEGTVRGSFDKFHLVPFGEYVPIRWLPGIDRVAPGESDFSPGPGPQTLNLPGLPPVSPLICYEIIFPGAVTEPGRRPGWLLNLTNDAWFGLSTGPYQHFASARLRAVEEGLPLVRVANTGISAIVDPYGRVLAQVPLGAEGVIDMGLPNALPLTPYARFRNAISAVLVLMLAVGARFARR